ncbi:MAG: mannose-1-phosphate guanylyltransferase, partial [Gammaproteobacteria bacterium]|nr:mannose-1-phosphate guanylyltransferase [Gammaproteobacteria bacterium]
MSAKLVPVILAGGGGTRLWPMSRRYYPKQFLSLDGNDSMLQKTLLRLNGLADRIEVSPATIICNEEHRFLVSEHAEAIGQPLQEIILEPVGRNTAPALTVAALKASPEDVLLMMPADHMIQNLKEFHQCIQAGVDLASDGYLVTFGIRPTEPETGYGYIKTGEALDGQDHSWLIGEFVEKPDVQTAIEYLESGQYYWNSGIFMMQSSVWLQAIQKFEPEIHRQCMAAVE